MPGVLVTDGKVRATWEGGVGTGTIERTSSQRIDADDRAEFERSARGTTPQQ